MSVPSPCTQRCRADDGFCRSCYRSVAEIKQWMHMNDSDRRKVLELCEERKRVRNYPFL